MSIRPAVIASHPALKHQMQERAESRQNRVADAITRFAGSMWFVYIHILWFAVWIVLNKAFAKFDPFPFGLLTMIVSLEAIFLSTFVMISQNRADEKRQALADHEWQIVQIEEQQNEQLITLSKNILDLTQAIHDLTVAHTQAS
jgi:uncharacterized membrane protein